MTTSNPESDPFFGNNPLPSNVIVALAAVIFNYIISMTEYCVAVEAAGVPIIPVLSLTKIEFC